MAEGHGGVRPGCGRKRREEKFAGPIASAEERIADRLPLLIDNLFELAGGGYERVREEWQPAGLILTNGLLRGDDGEILLNSKETPLTGQVRAFPDLDPTTLVLVKRHREIADRDREANINLIDRILGKPTQAIEAEISGPDGGAIPLEIQTAIDKVYGARDPEQSEQPDE